jgi:hypothetical protein
MAWLSAWLISSFSVGVWSGWSALARRTFHGSFRGCTSPPLFQEAFDIRGIEQIA